MKNLFCTIVLLLSFIGNAQIQTYTESTENITNPERGWYKHTSTTASNYEQLNQSSLNGYYNNNKYTLILRVIYLDSYINNPNIPSSFISKMQTDFNRIRAAGLKCIIRFAYTEDSDASQYDPNKATLLQHIEQLSTVIDTNKDVIAAIQMGFIGCWGEGYYSTYYGTGNLTQQNIADRNEILTAVLTQFPDEIMIQLRTPKFKIRLSGNTPTTQATAYNGSYISRLGLHNDAFLNGEDDEGTYDEDNLDVERSFAKENGRWTVVGGETNSVVPNYTNCSNALNELNDMSYDYLNSGYHPDVISQWQSGGCFNEITLRLGYRFVVTQTIITSTTLGITIKNKGFGHLYNERKVYLIYRHVATGNEYSFQLDTDARLWLKDNDILLTQNIPTLPQDGEYNVFIYMPGNGTVNPRYAIQFANNGMWDAVKGYNNLNIRLYPVALGINAVVRDNQININSTNYYVQIFDMTGKKVSENTDLSTLPTGVYIVKIEVDDNVYTIKVRKT